MLNIIKTELGSQVLKDRSISLTAKQRQLLILINTQHLDSLNIQLIEKLATPQILQELLDKGLIQNPNQMPNKYESKIINIKNETQIIYQKLSFEDVKILMSDLLQQHCGLIAKQLIQRIQHAENLHQITQCRMQWITHLQESKIQPLQLNHHLQQINFALAQLKEAQLETL